MISADNFWSIFVNSGKNQPKIIASNIKQIKLIQAKNKKIIFSFAKFK